MFKHLSYIVFFSILIEVLILQHYVEYLLEFLEPWKYKRTFFEIVETIRINKVRIVQNLVILIIVSILMEF